MKSTTRSLQLLLAVLTLSVVANAQAAAPGAKPSEPQTFRVGLKSIAIPSPSTNLTEIGSDYRVVLETLAPATNRLVAAFNRPEDLKQILSGGATPLPQYALVEIPRRAEFLDVDPASFQTVADSVAKGFGANLETDLKKGVDDLNRNLKELNSASTSVTMGKPFPLGTLFSKPDAAAFGLIQTVSTTGPEAKMAIGVVVLRAQSRVLFLYLYSTYKDESTVQWIRTTSEQWADAVLAANKK